MEFQKNAIQEMRFRENKFLGEQIQNFRLRSQVLMLLSLDFTAAFTTNISSANATFVGFNKCVKQPFLTFSVCYLTSFLFEKKFGFQLIDLPSIKETQGFLYETCKKKDFQAFDRNCIDTGRILLSSAEKVRGAHSCNTIVVYSFKSK